MTLSASYLTCGYRKRTAFADVSLVFEPGELFVILGPNGAGKTTLLRALARLIRPRTGQILLDGQDIWQLRPADVARAVAYNPQVLAADWPFRVREFVTLGRAPHAGWWRPLNDRDHEVIDRCLAELSLTEFQDRLVTELSGGEWQRVRLAKALAQEPRFLLLDEPTAHLDLRFQLELLSIVAGLVRSRNLSVVMTLHDLNLVGPWAQRVALLAEGKLLQVGTPAEVMTEIGLQSAFGVPLAVAAHPVTGAPMISLVSNSAHHASLGSR